MEEVPYTSSDASSDHPVASLRKKDLERNERSFRGRVSHVVETVGYGDDIGIAIVLPVRVDFCFGGGVMLCWLHPRWEFLRIRRVAVAAASMVLLAGAHARAESRSVGVASANFRTGPSTSQPILYTADRYYPVEILRCDNGWCETQDFEGDRAWVAERLLSEQPSVVVNVDRANVRHAPTTQAKVLFRVDWGEALKVTERKEEWIEIEDVEGERGWVHAKLTWGLSDSASGDSAAVRDEKAEDKPGEKDKAQEPKKEEPGPGEKSSPKAEDKP